MNLFIAYRQVVLAADPCKDYRDCNRVAAVAMSSLLAAWTEAQSGGYKDCPEIGRQASSHMDLICWAISPFRLIEDTYILDRFCPPGIKRNHSQCKS